MAKGVLEAWRLNRRHCLTFSAAPLILPFGFGIGTAARAAVPTDIVTVLYRQADEKAPTRSDPAIQAALLGLEAGFRENGLNVIQASPELLSLMDRSANLVVNFAPDAGLTLVFTANRSQRPMGGVDKIVAEVVLQARVFVGHSIFFADESRGRMAAEAGGATREFAERRSAEQAAQRAARELVQKIATRLRGTSAAEIERMASWVPAAIPAPMAAQSASTAAEPATVGRRFALVVAMSDYAPVRRRLNSMGGPSDLPGAKVDSDKLVQALKTLNFAPENIRLLHNDTATSASVRDELGQLVAKTKPDDLVLLAVTAHGAPAQFGPSGFGLPVLNDFNGVGKGDYLDFWQMQSLMANQPARRSVLVVDTCHSGGVTGMMQVVVDAQGVKADTGNGGPQPERMASTHMGGRAFAVIAAARPDQPSLETTADGGIFTAALIDALKKTQGRMTLEKLFQELVVPSVAAKAKTLCPTPKNCVQQNPIFAFSGSGNLIQLASEPG
jgi:hypothetical protein